MTQQSATIKVLCRTEALEDTAKMLQWALGHRVTIEENSPDAKTGCLFVFTDIEYYGTDVNLFENFGFDIIGKISGVVSWEILEQIQSKQAPDIEADAVNKAELENEKLPETTDENLPGKDVSTTMELAERERLELELMQKLCVLPITISIMPRMEGKFAWKCLEATGSADTFADALEEALKHFTYVFKLIRSELGA